MLQVGASRSKARWSPFTSSSFFVFTYRFTHYKHLTRQRIPEEASGNGKTFQKVTQKAVSSRNAITLLCHRAASQSSRAPRLPQLLNVKAEDRAIKLTHLRNDLKLLESYSVTSPRTTSPQKARGTPGSPGALNSAERKLDPDPPLLPLNPWPETTSRRSFPSSPIIIKD